MKEKWKELSKSLFFILFGIILLVVKTDSQSYLWGVIPLNTTVLGVIGLVAGVIMAIVALTKKEK